MENAQKQNQAEEIELGQFLDKILNLFKSIGNGIVRFLALLRSIPFQNKILFILFVIAGGAIGWTYATSLKKKFFDSSMILSSDYLNKRIIESSIDKLNLLAEEESPKGLAAVLHIPDTLARNIVKFDAKPFVAEKELIELEVLKEQLKNAQIKNQGVIDQITKRIEIENQHAFEFIVRTYSPTAIKPLQEALIGYFRNNDYVRRRIEINRINLGLRKNKLIAESQKLDSLKKVIYDNYRSMAEKQSRQGSNNVILSDKSVTNPLDVYSQDLLFNNEILGIDRQIYLQLDFEVVDGFTEFNEPTSASKSKIVATGMLIGFIFGYVVVGLRRFDKYLSEIG